MLKRVGWSLGAMALATALVCFLFLGAPSSACAGEEPIKLVFSSYLKKDFTNNLTCQYWMEEVSKRTKGRVQFKTFYDGTLLKGAESLPGCGRGMCDLTLCPDAYSADRHPLAMVQALMFLTDKMDSYIKSCNRIFSQEPLLIKEMTDNNVHFFANIPVSSVILGAPKKIDTLEALKDKRVRSMAMVAYAFKTLGATPVGLALGEVYDGLDKGVIDAYSHTDFTLASMFKLYEVAPYMHDTGLGQFGGMFFVINKTKWDSLPEDVKKVMQEAIQDAVAKHVALYQEVEAKMVDKAHAGGAKVVILSDAEKAKWKEVAGQKTWQKWIDDMKAKGLDGEHVFKAYQQICDEENQKSTYKSAYQVFADKFGAEK